MRASMWPAHATSANFALGARQPGDEPAALRKPIAVRNSKLNTCVLRDAPANARKRGRHWRKDD